MRKWFLLVLVVLASFARGEEALFVEASDLHGNYPNIPGFLRTIHHLARNSTDNFAGVNGDLGGAGLWPEYDLGWLDYELVISVARRFRTSTTLGNHEGFDYESPLDHALGIHGLFQLQNRQFKLRLDAVTGRDNRVLAANLVPTAEGDFLGQYMDYAIFGDKTIRRVGIGVESLIEESSYDPSAPRQLFELPVRPVLTTMKRQYRKAVRDQINFITFQIHEGARARLVPLVQNFEGWLTQHFPSEPTRVLFVIGGHHHKVYPEASESQVTRIPIFEGGKAYSFWEIRVNETGAITHQRFWSVENQQALETNVRLPEAVQRVSQRAELYVEHLRREFSEVLSPALTPPQVLVYSRRPDGGRLDPHDEARRYYTGVHFAYGLRRWGQAVLGREQIEVIDVIPFQNKLSFSGSSSPLLFEGPITRERLRRVVHFRSAPGLVVLTGRQIQEFYHHYRTFGENSSWPFHTPIIAGPFRETTTPDGGIQLEHRLNHRWNPLEPGGHYGLALDGFSARNGYNVTGVSDILEAAIWRMENPPPTAEVMEQYSLILPLQCRRTYERLAPTFSNAEVP